MKTPFLCSACLLLVACGNGSASPEAMPPAQDSSAATSVAYTLPADPEHGKLTHLAIGPLAGQDGLLANGTAALWMFSDDTARVSIQLNIAVAAQGTVYIAWLKDPSDGTLEKVGTLKNTAGDVRHALTIEAQKDYSRYSEVIVTRESSAGVSVPSKIVANGILKTKGL